jgi:hypothetical protein
MAEPLPFPVGTEINLSQGWTLEYSNTFTATILDGNKAFSPMSLQEIPTLFYSPVIACVTATTTLQNPLYMGKLIQAFNIGVNNGQLSNFTSRSLFIGNQTIMWRQDISPPYRLRFKPFKRLRQVSLLIYSLNP